MSILPAGSQVAPSPVSPASIRDQQRALDAARAQALIRQMMDRQVVYASTIPKIAKL